AGKCVLDRDLPDARRADKHVARRVADQLSRLGWQPRIVGHCPKRDVSVQQQLHGSDRENSAVIAASSASMESGTLNRPLATPIRRAADRAATATRRAAGRPLR